MNGTPSPSVYWNHRLRAKMQINLWGTITCGQNLDVKELAGWNRYDKDPKREDAVSAHRHGLGHDRAIEMAGARLDVTGRLWKNTHFAALAIFTPREAAAYRAMPLYSASAICSR